MVTLWSFIDKNNCFIYLIANKKEIKILNMIKLSYHKTYYSYTKKIKDNPRRVLIIQNDELSVLLSITFFLNSLIY